MLRFLSPNQSLLLPKPATKLRVLLSMSDASSSSMLQNALCSSSAAAARLPSLGADETSAVADEAFRRHTSPGLRRGGGAGGVAIVWFRSDLRVLDNDALVRAWEASEAVLPVYCVDPRIFGGGVTHRFGFPKTGALRAQFLIECLVDLKENLRKQGLDLLVRHGKPEDILPSIAKAVSAHTVYAHKETCSEELLVERLVRNGLEQVVIPQGGASNQNKSCNPKLQLIWGATMYHIDDLPFPVSNLPNIYTQLRKSNRSPRSGTAASCHLRLDRPPVLAWMRLEGGGQYQHWTH